MEAAAIYCLAMHELQAEIERLASAPPEAGGERERARQTFFEFRRELSAGRIRAAEKIHGRWRVNVWVKQGILLGFRLGDVVESESGALSFVDKDTFPARHFRAADGVRVVAGGSSVGEGAYVAASVILSPPMFIKTGACDDEG